MANPQLENGYTKIADEILEAFAASNLFSANGRIFYFIIRSTYGFKKTKHQLTATFISEGTGLSLRQVKRSLSELKKANVIKRDNSVTGIQKNWELWIKGGDSSVTVTRMVNRGDKNGQIGVTNLSPKRKKENKERKKDFFNSIKIDGYTEEEINNII